MRRLALCVDDYGLDEGIHRAVQALALAGRISATSCMTAAPHWRAGAARLRALDAAAPDAGLHLDLTQHCFDPALRQPLPAWLLRTRLQAVPRAALRVEIARQLDAFEAALGRAPTHVDGHQHVHQLPVVRELLLAQLAQRYPQQRPWLRSTLRPRGAGPAKARVIEALGGRALVRLATRRGFGMNGHLLGVYGFDADAPRYLALLEGWLAACGDGDLLMCHPRAGAAVAGDPIAAARQVEYGVLAGQAFGAALARQGVRLARLGPGESGR